MERLTLNPENVSRAERREGFTHPLLTVLDIHANRIAQLITANTPGYSPQDLESSYIRT